MQNENQLKCTVSVGIPAYNEEANIGYLLNDLLAQKEEGYTLEKIYVYSDGSTDATESIVCGIQDERVELVCGPGRMGQAYGQNTIMQMAQSDYLVLLNADIQIKDIAFIQKLIRPLMDEGTELVSVKQMPLQPKTFWEEVLATSVELKDILFGTYNNGSNVYTCHGHARAFSRKLYKEMVFTSSIGEDAYAYLYCVSHGYGYRYIQNTETYYRLPNNFTDHKSQSTRFFQGRNNFGDTFGEGFVRQSMHIPLSVCLKAFIKAVPIILRKPVTAGIYLLLVAFLRMQALFIEAGSETWEIARSSKRLR